MVMRETLDGFQGGLQFGGQMITNLHYADDIILLAGSATYLFRMNNWCSFLYLGSLITEDGEYTTKFHTR